MIDVIEIDAASYTGVDNIREVIEHAKFTPTQGKYKIYIIDEVHMLSKGAFNALLKTLEEPPKHVIFLLATTEINKVPDTVLSRVIRFDLERINDGDMRWLLEKICKNEGIQAELWAINLIIHRSRWSLRDSLTILEKCILDNALTQSYVESALHLVNQDFLKKTLQACISWDGVLIQEVLETIRKTGLNVRTFAGQMTEYIVSNIEIALEQKQFPLYKSVFDRFTRIYVESRQISVPMDVLTMSLCECITKNSDAIKYTMDDNELWKQETVIVEEIKIAQPIVEPEPESKTEPEPEEILTSEKKEPEIERVEVHEDIAHIPEVTKQEIMETPTLSTNRVTPAPSVAEIFIQKILEWGVKQNLIPLLKTADITMENDILTIKTTGFAETMCKKNENWRIIEAVSNWLGAKSIHITLLDEVQIPSPIEAATEIFG